MAQSFNILTILIYRLQIILCSALLALWYMDHHNLEWPPLWHLCIDKKQKTKKKTQAFNAKHVVF